MLTNYFKILLGFLTISCNTSQKILTEEDFTKTFLNSLKVTYPEYEFDIKDNLTIICIINGKEIYNYLSNAYNEYKTHPDLLEKIQSIYINSTAELFNKREVVMINRIIPMIKPIDYLSELKQIQNEIKESQEVNLVYEQYNDQLLIVYGEDTENNIRYFMQDDLKKINLSNDTLLEFSLNNLNALLPPINKLRDNKSYKVSCGGIFENSLILFKSLWTKENFDVDGDFVIAIPNRYILLITGSNNKEEIQKMKGFIKDSYHSSPYPVSPFLFRWNGEKFVKYQ